MHGPRVGLHVTHHTIEAQRRAFVADGTVFRDRRPVERALTAGARNPESRWWRDVPRCAHAGVRASTARGSGSAIERAAEHEHRAVAKGAEHAEADLFRERKEDPELEPAARDLVALPRHRVLIRDASADRVLAEEDAEREDVALVALAIGERAALRGDEDVPKPFRRFRR